MAAPPAVLPDYMLKIINGELSEEQKQAHYDTGLKRCAAAAPAAWHAGWERQQRAVAR
jgi:hypothetical protein